MPLFKIICCIAASQVISIWQNLWSSYKDHTRREKTEKTGDAAAKKLDPKKKMLMQKMKYFEPFVADVFSGVLTSAQINPKAKITASSIWRAQEQNPKTNETKRKTPPTSKHYNAREDKKEKIFKLVEDLATKVGDITQQSQEIINNNREAAPAISASPEDQNRKALLNIIDEFFINLTPTERSLCLADMLEAIARD